MAVIIKRYRNRKLYNTQTKCYTNLEQIGDLIKEQAEVKVVDNASGMDITSTILSQIIFELEKNRSGFLPTSLLLSLVESSGSRIEEIRRNIFNSLNLAHHYDVEIEWRIDQLIEQGKLAEEAGIQIRDLLLSVSTRRNEFLVDIEDRVGEFLKQRQIPTRKEIRELIQKIDDLSTRVEEL